MANGNGNGAWWKPVISYIAVAVLGAAGTIVFGNAAVVSRSDYEKDQARIEAQFDKQEAALASYDKEVRKILVDLMTKTTRIEAQIEEVNRRLDAQGYYSHRSNVGAQ